MGFLNLRVTEIYRKLDIIDVLMISCTIVEASQTLKIQSECMFTYIITLSAKAETEYLKSSAVASGTQRFNIKRDSIATYIITLVI